ncbi:MAG: thioredoxin domain-containing protein [Candidatus Gracilibacteria bacterium]|nr:thioredoxin domain-containing protein [Candidatus Gracilibacteria bacterium]
MANKENNNKVLILQSTIVILLVIIAVLAFFMGKNMGNNPTPQNGNTNTNTSVAQDLNVTIIDDKRCLDCQTSAIVDQLKQVPNLASANFETKDFSDKGVEELVKNNGIQALPSVIFSHNNVDAGLTPYLTQLNDGTYSLNVGSTFDPFAQRSENGFLVADKELLEQIKSTSYVKGSIDATITWIEYSDLECPYCAKLHENGTPKDLTEKYGDKLNVIFNHFPLDFHANAMPAAQILECTGEQLGSEAFYAMIEKSFKENNSDADFLVKEAVNLGADKSSLESCLDSDKYKEKIQLQQTTGANNFGITGTPGNVLINNETGEYQVISGAYPTSEFEKAIDKLLGE